MTELERPHIGIISDCPLQRHALQKTLSGYGLNIAVICDPDRLGGQLQDRVDKVECWIVEVDEDGEDAANSEALDTLIVEAEKPILFGLGKAPEVHDESFISWERRLLSKLEEHLGQVEITDSEEAIKALDSQDDPTMLNSATRQKAEDPNKRKVVSENIWVLAASLGGPAAVKEFLDEMPSRIRAGFLYAQHIDAHFSKVLTNVLGRHAELDLKPIQEGDVVFDGDVMVVPVDQEIQFSEQGITIKNNEWSGPYGPSIDHLLANVFKHYQSRCHVIVFSGMGNDGAMTIPKMHSNGCQIWTQTPDSCANGSMPESIIELECSMKSGTPKELAKAFIEYVGCHA